jgi:hypothetical protein
MITQMHKLNKLDFHSGQSEHLVFSPGIQGHLALSLQIDILPSCLNTITSAKIPSHLQQTFPVKTLFDHFGVI